MICKLSDWVDIQGVQDMHHVDMWVRTSVITCSLTLRLQRLGDLSKTKPKPLTDAIIVVTLHFLNKPDDFDPMLRYAKFLQAYLPNSRILQISKFRRRLYQG
jgi:hypothetical protein